MSDIGGKLRSLRQGKKLTQHQLADRININRSTICNYEINRRKPSLEDLQKFCTFYGVGLDYFGMATSDEVFDLLQRARNLLDNPAVSDEDKESLYREIMKMYLSIEKGK